MFWCTSCSQNNNIFSKSFSLCLSGLQWFCSAASSSSSLSSSLRLLLLFYLSATIHLSSSSTPPSPLLLLFGSSSFPNSLSAFSKTDMGDRWNTHTHTHTHTLMTHPGFYCNRWGGGAKTRGNVFIRQTWGLKNMLLMLLKHTHTHTHTKESLYSLSFQQKTTDEHG